MDTSVIKANKVNTTNGLKVGNPDAPVKVIEFINLRCPYSKQWFENSYETLHTYVKEGKVQRIVKHFDKESSGLRKGNLLHGFLNYEKPEKSLEDIYFFFDHLSQWGMLEDEDIKKFAEKNRKLENQNNKEEAKAIIDEAKEANVTLVPTVVIGEHIFDESISEEELVSYIEEELQKNTK